MITLFRHQTDINRKRITITYNSSNIIHMSQLFAKTKNNSTLTKHKYSYPRYTKYLSLINILNILKTRLQRVSLLLCCVYSLQSKPQILYQNGELKRIISKYILFDYFFVFLKSYFQSDLHTKKKNIINRFIKMCSSLNRKISKN